MDLALSENDLEQTVSNDTVLKLAVISMMIGCH